MHAAYLNTTPSSSALIAPRAAYLFQPHHLAVHTLESLEHTRGFMTYGISSFLSDNTPVTVYLEDGSVKAQAYKRKVAHILKTGKNVDAHLNKAIERGLERLKAGDGSAGYAAFINTVYLQMREISHIAHLDADNHLSMEHERSPRIFKPGAKTFLEADIFENEPKMVKIRTAQILASSVVRDITYIAQIFRGLESKRNEGLFLVRGTNHLGMLTFMKMMTEHGYPHLSEYVVDVDEKRLLIGDSVEQKMILPILWNRKFWQEIIENYPDILKLTQKIFPERDLNRLFTVVRKMVENGTWGQYIDRFIEETKKGNRPKDDDLFPIILSQEDFA